MGGYVLNIIVGAIYARKAYKGEWAEYTTLGRWARRLAGEAK